MQKLGIHSVIRRKKAKYKKSAPETTAENKLKRDFNASAPNEKWTTDVSQFNLPWGKCYISPLLDMHTNEVVSYNLSLHPNMEQIKDMLTKAFDRDRRKFCVNY